jgi:hypothetical protein
MHAAMLEEKNWKTMQEIKEIGKILWKMKRRKRKCGAGGRGGG